MITAKNYAAQVEIDMQMLSVKFPADTEILKTISGQIKTSIHFSIPDEGVILSDGLKGLEGIDLKLPFKNITIEYYSKVNSLKILILAVQSEEEIIFIPFYQELNYKAFVPASSKCGFLDCKEPFGVKKTRGYPSKNHFIVSNNYSDDVNDVNLQMATRPIVELLEALSCTNITTEPLEQIDPKKNAKRIKAGKLPIYETKILVLKTPQTVSKGQPGGGAHASPRQHLRRGHIRRHHTAGNIWVNNCVVGDPAKGIIDKQYRVKK